jgi:hypothetical protein
LIPFNLPDSLSWSRHLLKPSAIRIKRRGNNGHPCLRPREGGKKDEAEPLINRDKEKEEEKPSTQLTKSLENPT